MDYPNIVHPAVQTREIPATDTHPALIRAEYDGRVFTTVWPDKLGPADAHRIVAKALLIRLGMDPETLPMYTGILPGGDHCHVLVI